MIRTVRISDALKYISGFLAGAAVFSASFFCCFAENETPADPGSVRNWTYEADSEVSVSSGIKSGIALDMTYGYRNTAKSGHKLPVSVSIFNYEASDFEGRLTIEAPGSVETGIGIFEESANRYVYDILVPAGSETVLDCLISIPEDRGNARLSLTDNSGRTVSKKEVGIEISTQGNELLIGVLSNTPDRLDYFDGVSVAQTSLRTRTIELEPANMPETALELEQLDMIVISNFNITQLSDARIAAIEEWVENGGVLLVGSGMSSKAAAVFGRGVQEFSIGNPERKSIDMGMKYSKTGPDGAVLELNVCDIVAPEGIQVMQSADTALLTAVTGINGMIGFTAYDLCDISEFCSQEISYTDELLQALLGSSRIERMINSAGSSSEVFEKTERFLGVTDPGEMPGTGIYIFLAAAYLAFIGCILYFWLRGRGLEIYYHAFVVISAFACTFVIWMIGSGYRNNGITLQYAAVRELHGNGTSENGFINMFSAASGQYSVHVPDHYELYPIVHSSETPGEGASDELQSDPGTEGSRYFEFSRIPGNKSVTASGLGPFAGMMMEYSSRQVSGEKADDISARIHFYDEELSGRIVNNTGQVIEDAAVLLYGRVVRLGDIPAGGELDLEGLSSVVTPTADSAAVADYITGLHEFEPDSPAYIDALKRSRFLGNYMQESLEAYYSGARLVGFSREDGMFSDFQISIPAEVSGTLLKVCFADSEFRKGRQIWRNGLSYDPSVISGEYDTASNTSHGSVVLEYNLGTDVNITSLGFTEMDTAFENGQYTGFRGQISLYNYQKGNYEYIREKRSFSAAEIRPYLSPANTLMARYLPDDMPASPKPVFLPVPNITGVER